MATTMPDTPANRDALVRFVAQELTNDPGAPPCDAGGLRELIAHAGTMSGRPEALSLRLRELGGIVRSAADVAVAAGEATIGADSVREAIALVGRASQVPQST
jgi:Lon-like ATP-dependent protease